MTQPAVHGQFQQDAPQDTPHGTPPGAAQAPAQGSRPEAVSGRRVPGAAGRATAWRKAAVIAAAGVPVGLLWWLLAPSGLNLLSGNPELRSGGNTEGWLPRDLVLAGLFLLAGCISAQWPPAASTPSRPGGTFCWPLGAGAVGALAAWGTGVLCGLWWGAPQDTSANASIAFSLRSFAVLAIWPAATALTLFLNTVFATPKPDAGQGGCGTAFDAPGSE